MKCYVVDYSTSKETFNTLAKELLPLYKLLLYVMEVLITLTRSFMDILIVSFIPSIVTLSTSKNLYIIS